MLLNVSMVVSQNTKINCSQKLKTGFIGRNFQVYSTINGVIKRACKHYPAASSGKIYSGLRFHHNGETVKIGEDIGHKCQQRQSVHCRARWLNTCLGSLLKSKSRHSTLTVTEGLDLVHLLLGNGTTFCLATHLKKKEHPHIRRKLKHTTY